MPASDKQITYISQRAASSYLKSLAPLQTASLVEKYALMHEALPKLK